MKSALLYGNTLLLAALLAGGVVVFLKRDELRREVLEAPPVEEVTTSDPEGADIDLHPLTERLEALEARLARLEGPGKASVEEAAEEGTRKTGNAPETDPGSPPGDTGDTGNSPARKAQVRKALKNLVKEVMREQALEEEKKRQAQPKGKPRKTISQVSKELGLSYEQEDKLRVLHRGLINDLVKIIFDVKDDKDLPALKEKLREAEYNPELKEKLGEQIAVNWAQSQPKFQGAMVGAVLKMRKFLNPEQMAAIDKVDLQPDKKEWPDLEKMFFPKEKKE